MMPTGSPNSTFPLCKSIPAALPFDGNMIREASAYFRFGNNRSAYIVENVGNLVCPAEF